MKKPVKKGPIRKAKVKPKPNRVKPAPAPLTVVLDVTPKLWAFLEMVTAKGPTVNVVSVDELKTFIQESIADGIKQASKLSGKDLAEVITKASASRKQSSGSTPDKTVTVSKSKQFEEDAAEEAEEKVIGLTEIREAIESKLDQHKEEGLRKLFKKINCKSASDIPEEDYDEVYAAIKAL